MGPLNTSGKKKCTMCKTLQDISKFSRNKTTRDGLQYECKECRNLRKLKKVVCTCGRSVSREYHDKHLTTEYHRNTIVPEDVRGRISLSAHSKEGKQDSYPSGLYKV